MNRKLEKAAADVAAVAETVEKLRIQIESLLVDIERLKNDAAIVDVIRAISERGKEP